MASSLSAGEGKAAARRLREGVEATVDVRRGSRWPLSVVLIHQDYQNKRPSPGRQHGYWMYRECSTRTESENRRLRADRSGEFIETGQLTSILNEVEMPPEQPGSVSGKGRSIACEC